MKYSFIIFSFLLPVYLSLDAIATSSGSTENIPLELEIRGGLPNFFNKARRGDSLNVAYFGGSITAQNGWRVLSLEWLREKYPHAHFSEINAAIGGTGSDLGVFRLNDHVLKFNPDLIFVEFAVNDSKKDSETIIRSMEGIVRQVWKYNPFIDICFVYTLKEDLIKTLCGGQLFPSEIAMERVAGRYNIPSVNFGPEVCKMLDDNKLIIKGKNKEQDGIMVFSPDGVHPYPETGHQIYQSVIKRTFELMERNQQTEDGKHRLPKPLTSNNYSNAHLLDFTETVLSKNWTILDTKKSTSLSNFNKYFGNIARAGLTGETISFTFKGTDVGCYDIVGPDAGRVIVEIDGVVKDTVSRFDAYCTYSRMNYFLIENLDNKKHKVVFRVLSDPFDKAAILSKNGNVIKDPADYKENNWYLGKIMINGKLIK